MSEQKGSGRGKLFAKLPEQPSLSQTCTEPSTSSVAPSYKNAEKPAGASTVRSKGRGVLLELLTKKVSFQMFFNRNCFSYYSSHFGRIQFGFRQIFVR